MVSIIAWIVSLFQPNPEKKSGRTVLLTGGKMTKCLQLARMFKSRGDYVIVAETSLYRYCGTRFSRAVDQFEVVQEIMGNGEEFINSLVSIATRHQVDLFVPVSSPKSSFYEALSRESMPSHTTVFQPDAAIVAQLDDKHQFIKLAQSYGLSVPESFFYTTVEGLLEHDFKGKKFILKKLDYDPVYRLDLRPLPHNDWEDRVRNLPIGKDEPWILQEFIEGREICTHTTTVNGAMNMYVCCDSSPFQVNYKMLDLPSVKDWVTTFLKNIKVTGQLSFDFIIDRDNRVLPIECNPRTHSAITLFHNQPGAIQAYDTQDNCPHQFTPHPNSGHTYWLYHELYRLVTARSFNRFRFIAGRMLSGQEAIFRLDDPWVFFCHNHVGIPYQLLVAIWKNWNWTRIDFNIGKLVIPGGD